MRKLKTHLDNFDLLFLLNIYGLSEHVCHPTSFYKRTLGGSHWFMLKESCVDRLKLFWFPLPHQPHPHISLFHFAGDRKKVRSKQRWLDLNMSKTELLNPEILSTSIPTAALNPDNDQSVPSFL